MIFFSSNRAKAKRKLVCPNSGFVSQLKLFYRMNFTIDTNHKKYKIYRLRLAAEKVRICHLLPSSFMDLVKTDPNLMNANPEPVVYRCRKCRRIVASKSNLITHNMVDRGDLDLSSYDSPIHSNEMAYGASSSSTHFLEESTDAIGYLTDKIRSASFSDKSSSDKEKETPKLCQKMYFVEPLAWMKDILHNTQGRLYCPKCNSKLGSFNWVMASKCPCGAQISPAFYLVPSKVEFSNIVQNVVQVTI